jgi:hypothetical protein
MAHERRLFRDFIFPTGGLRLNGAVAGLPMGGLSLETSDALDA